MSISFDERFEVLKRLHGEEGVAKLRASQAVVIGVGGVGSWAAEAICRSGIERIRLIDMDTVAASNTNRQSEAVDGAYGRPKAQVLAERFHTINPDASVEVLQVRVTTDNVSQMIPEGAVILECVDDVDAKAAIVAQAKKKGNVVIVSGGAGGRTDPTQIRLADLTQVAGDALLSKLRYTLRKRFGFPAGSMKRSKPFGVLAAFSPEPMRQGPGGVFGTSMAVTAAMGMAVASAAIRAALEKGAEK